ncbi:UDP-N-acetylglucosamine--N-acetylmuramyl-(pentapeptide) pyrophosphoryl-undecaprenol N-acetylglucosamine transferase [Pseudalkalibacillus caeni]|uniref:UDP-N-acetylglucosamine--N-acetylmuramyl-(Pentapeptide) pyrophosphoryl-undecaprenol N-acetylglucosamine transferase n=1 Tax=Exobacillus caeni TaxID=2574798 RepID=A0A5R9EVA8_9BACL|nr:UDP-N-acetylglucosamine--N-acetylmuramyl-(pentapeptide) pyrophosphoryl-undecaprenol N-acetylglucosamine transferase [Pseudalkalibacillus caeni]TLS35162.1 UDP-N-acetylglucosamine--N-acetylmuramyl-(pentapeptide) pyrophosphoryl-undecaprenol N-acetylglucosamine transferase [Pseudalkalibacillus caeni]
MESIKEICNKFWEVENRHNLLSKQICEVKFWEVIRYELLNEILRNKGIYGEAHTKKKTIWSNFVLLSSIVYNSIFFNPLFGIYTKDILVFEHPRKVRKNGRYIDIYTNHLLNENDEIQFLEPDSRKRNTKSKEKGVNKKTLDLFYPFAITKMKQKKIFLDEKELNLLKNIEHDLKKEFNVEVNLYDKVKKAIRKFKIQYDFYQKILRKRKPKEIYLVVGYLQPALIHAAKSIGIKVIELQHGVINKYHLGYNFPNQQQKVDYFADKLLIFGEFWKKGIRYPIPSEDIKVIGFPFFNMQVEKYRNITKKPKQIIFISQGTVGHALSKFAYHSALELKDYTFIYKLHPGEYDRWKREYIELVKASQLKNFNVVDSNDKDLHYYLSESEFQVGVYSTALYEGFSLKCKTILFQYTGVEYLEEIVKEGFAKVVTNISELKQVLVNNKAVENEYDIFFKKTKQRLLRNNENTE